MGAAEVPLEDKMLTIVYSTDMINISFLNLATNSKEIAQVRNFIIWEMELIVTFIISSN